MAGATIAAVLLAQLVTNRTSHLRAATLVAIDTRLHLHPELQLDRIAGPDISVAAFARHLLLVPRVAEEDEVR